MPWYLLLIPAIPYSARLITRALRDRELQKHDRIVLVIVAALIMIAASTPWLVLTASRAYINSVQALYWRAHMTWPVVAFHAWFIMISVTIGLWLTFGHGAEFVVRHRRMLLVPMTSESVMHYVGWALLCYPVIYLVILDAASR